MKVTHDPERIEKYLRYLKRKIKLLAPLLSARRPVTQIHWGGGTPTLLTPDQIRDLGACLQKEFQVDPSAEISLEADPRGLTEDHITEDHIAAARAVGFTRLSFGVQTFDQRVQKAINRVQPERLTRTAVRWARTHNVESINVDLVYGLPHQTPDTLAGTAPGAQRSCYVAAAFDAYLHDEAPDEQPTYSKSV